MSGTKLLIVGGGEHARVVVEAARSRPELWDVVGFVDPDPCLETVRRLGLRRLGGDDVARALANDHRFVLGVGATGISSIRRRLVESYTASAQWASVIHVAAWVSPTAIVEPGAVVMAGAMVQSGASIGAHTVVNTGAIVEHDVRLGAFAQVGPAAVVGGGAEIGEDAYLGLGCRVRDHVRVGVGALVGMGAVVVGPVENGARVVGVPARVLPI